MLSAKILRVGRVGAKRILQSRNTGLGRVPRRAFSDAAPEWTVPFTNLVEMHANACEKFADRECLGTRNGDKFDFKTYSEFGRDTKNVRSVLAANKVGFNDKVAMISNNRYEWACIMYGTLGMGGQAVPMYEAQMEKDWQYILKDSNAKLLVVATEAIYEKTKDYAGKVGNIENVICMDAPEHRLYSYKHWMTSTAEQEAPAISDKITPQHVSTLIYTSGTTGLPKGVELSHDAIVANLRGVQHLWKDKLAGCKTLAFLPWAHVFGLTCELHSMISTGSSLAIVPSREQIVECIPLARPTMMLSVPVLFNRVYDGVMKQVNAGSGLKKSLFTMALQTARERNSLLEFHKEVPFLLGLKFALFDKIVFSKIREKLGGRLERMCAGGAATSVTVLQFFEDVGIPISEGYGLTETAPMITCGGVGWGDRRLGCVGPALHGVDIRIIDPDSLEERPLGSDGEITCAGRILMDGYRNNKKATDEVFYTHNGRKYFRTGDQGRMIDGKFLKITGRIKEQFKLENGKYVVPAPLEDVFQRSPLVAQIFISGGNKPHTSALIVPEMAEVQAWLAKDGAALKDLAPTPEQLKDPSVHTIPLYEHPDFVAFMNKELDIASHNVCKGYEKPQKWTALLHLFSQENQMLTPKMSLRRNNILKEYQHHIDAMYAGSAGQKIKYTRNDDDHE